VVVVATVVVVTVVVTATIASWAALIVAALLDMFEEKLAYSVSNSAMVAVLKEIKISVASSKPFHWETLSV
jgi:hypothetical protein